MHGKRSAAGRADLHREQVGKYYDSAFTQSPTLTPVARTWGRGSAALARIHKIA